MHNRGLYDLKEIAKVGGSISLDASKLTTYELKELAKSLKEGATLQLTNCSLTSTYDLKEIAKAVKPGMIIFS